MDPLTTTSPSRIEPAPAPVRTRLQHRLLDEQAMHLEQRNSRDGSPESYSEIERELTMITGAMEGVYQRLGSLAAALEPLLKPGTVSRLADEASLPEPANSAWEPDSPIGRSLREHQIALGELEAALGTLRQQLVV